MSFRFPLLAALTLSAALVAAHAADVNFTVGNSNGSLRSLLGINIGPLGTGTAGNPALTTGYQQLGVNLIRTHDYYDPLDMATLYPDRSKDPDLASSFNFTGVLGADFRSSDEVFGSIVNNGFEPFFRLGDSYNNAKPPTDSERANWVKAAVNVLRHYRQGQWNGYQSNFRYVEIWNEPDNLIFWPRPFTQAQFNQLYDATAKAVRAAFPDLKIGGPGVTPGGCMSDSGKQWVGTFLDQVKQNNTPLDYFSWHMYSNTPSQYATCAAYYRTQLDARGFTTVPTLLTEWNTSAEGSELSAQDKLAFRTQAKGAAVLTGAWIAMQQRDDVEQTLFYRGPDPSMNAPTFYGIYYANGQPKKVALAWQLWKDISQATQRLAVTGTDPDLHLLAARHSNGDLQLLAANTSDTPKTWSVALPGGQTLANHQVSVRTVSDSTSGIAASTLTGSVASTPAHTVQLLTLTSAPTQAFGVTAVVTGIPAALNLTAQLKVASADQGQSGQVFLVAHTGSAFFAHNGTSWVPVGAQVPAWVSGPLLDSYTVPVFRGLDVRALQGVQVFAGYGLSVEDMLLRGLFGLVRGF